MQRAGFGQPALSLLKDVGDVVTGERVVDQGIVEACRLLRAIDIGQSNDPAQVQPPGQLRSANWR